MWKLINPVRYLLKGVNYRENILTSEPIAPANTSPAFILTISRARVIYFYTSLSKDTLKKLSLGI